MTVSEGFMDTNRLRRRQCERMRVASDRAHQIFRLAHRHGITAEAAEKLYRRANGDWTLAGTLAEASPAVEATPARDTESDLP